MVDVVSSIGATGRDYATIAAWEADLDNGAVYSAGDDAIGELYADGDFTEAITIDQGSALNSITLRAATGEEHDGTPNSGVRVLFAGRHQFTTPGLWMIVKDIEFDFDGFSTSLGYFVAGGGDDLHIERCMFHNATATGGSQTEFFVQGGTGGLTRGYNNLFFDINNTGQGGMVVVQIASAVSHIWSNNTIWDCDGGLAGLGTVTWGFQFTDNANTELRNNLVSVTSANTVADYNLSSPSSAVTQTNASADATSPESGLRSVSITFEDTASGDYRLASGDTDAIDQGTDLGAGDLAIDMLQRDRDAEGDTWDLGAFEYVAGAGGGTTLLQTKNYQGMNTMNGGFR